MTEPKRTKDEQGREVLIYPSGLKKDAKTGFFLEPPTSAKITTSEQGRELRSRRMALARERAIEGIDEAAIEAGRIPTRSAGSGEGWKAIVRHVAKTLLESKNLRGQAEAANFLGKASGLNQEEIQSDIAGAIARLFERFLDSQAREEVEGKVIDV